MKHRFLGRGGSATGEQAAKGPKGKRRESIPGDFYKYTAPSAYAQMLRRDKTTLVPVAAVQAVSVYVSRLAAVAVPLADSRRNSQAGRPRYVCRATPLVFGVAEFPVSFCPHAPAMDMHTDSRARVPGGSSLPVQSN